MEHKQFVFIKKMTVVTCRISGWDRLLSTLNVGQVITYGSSARNGVSCEIYLAIWFSGTKERAGWAGKDQEYGYRNRMASWLTIARRRFIKSPVCGVVRRKATSKPVYDNLTGLRMYGQRVLFLSFFVSFYPLRSPCVSGVFPYRLKNNQGRRVSLLADYTGMCPHGVCYRGSRRGLRSHGNGVGGDETSSNVFLAPGAYQWFLLWR